MEQPRDLLPQELIDSEHCQCPDCHMTAAALSGHSVSKPASSTTNSATHIYYSSSGTRLASHLHVSPSGHHRKEARRHRPVNLASTAGRPVCPGNAMAVARPGHCSRDDRRHTHPGLDSTQSTRDGSQTDRLNNAPNSPCVMLSSKKSMAFSRKPHFRLLATGSAFLGVQIAKQTLRFSLYGCVNRLLRRTFSSVVTRSTEQYRCLTYLTLVILALSSVVCPSAAGKVVMGTLTRNISYQTDQTMDMTTYLSMFGYLPPSDMETGALRTTEEMENAVKKFQRMAQLPVTGRVDERTQQMMQTPRCGVMDVLSPGQARMGDNVRHHRHRHRRYLLGPSKWEQDYVTFRIMSYTPDLTQYQVRDAIYRAFRLWSDVTDLSFHELQSGDADIRIRFVRTYHQDGYPFEGPGMTLAHAFFPGEDIGGDVHFDDDERWTYNSEEGTNLFQVAAHEIGHALGLGHSSVVGSLMYPWYAGYSRDFRLHRDDIAGIQYIYGYKYIAPATERPAPGSTSGSVVPTARPTPPSTWPPLATPRATRPPVSTTTLSPNQSPDPCTTILDAVALIRTEAFFFKNRWFWRMNENGVMDGYPVEIDRFWYGLPDDLPGFDAVYERKDEDKIIFFKERKYWVFNGNRMIPGFTEEGRPITDFGLPSDIERIDAAFVWGYNGKTYLITGNMYWRYNELAQLMDQGYPRDMSMWEGVPVPVSAAFQFWDGSTYFFKDRQYWKFNDGRMRVREGYPKLLGPYWLDCTLNAKMNNTSSTVAGVTCQSMSNTTVLLVALVALVWRSLLS